MMKMNLHVHAWHDALSLQVLLHSLLSLFISRGFISKSKTEKAFKRTIWSRRIYLHDSLNCICMVMQSLN